MVVGFATGEIPKLPFNLPLLKASSVIGIHLLLAWEAEPEQIAENLQFLLNALNEGKINVPPASTVGVKRQSGPLRLSGVRDHHPK